MKGAGFGGGFVLLQFGPISLMKEVLPIRILFWIVKLEAEETAIPQLNAPPRWLSVITPERVKLLPSLLPNQVRGPTAMPILYKRITVSDLP